jgi:hypothetical protein
LQVRVIFIRGLVVTTKELTYATKIRTKRNIASYYY